MAEVRDLLETLRGHYPYEIKTDADTIKLWVATLKDCNARDAQRAVHNWIRQEPLAKMGCPTPAKIAKSAREDHGRGDLITMGLRQMEERRRREG